MNSSCYSITMETKVNLPLFFEIRQVLAWGFHVLQTSWAIMINLPWFFSSVSFFLRVFFCGSCCIIQGSVEECVGMMRTRNHHPSPCGRPVFVSGRRALARPAGPAERPAVHQSMGGTSYVVFITCFQSIFDKVPNILIGSKSCRPWRKTDGRPCSGLPGQLSDLQCTGRWVAGQLSKLKNLWRPRVALSITWQNAWAMGPTAMGIEPGASEVTGTSSVHCAHLTSHCGHFHVLEYWYIWITQQSDSFLWYKISTLPGFPAEKNLWGD
jgi:hypothetical protein